MPEIPLRPKLQELSEAQLAPLEAVLPPQWPEVWKDFAYSFYCTLLASPPKVQADAAELCLHLAQGIAKDLGGTQPYIPVGHLVSSNTNAAKALDLLGKGYSYKAAAGMCGLTESRVRQLETEHRKSRAKA